MYHNISNNKQGHKSCVHDLQCISSQKQGMPTSTRRKTLISHARRHIYKMLDLSGFSKDASVEQAVMMMARRTVHSASDEDLVMLEQEAPPWLTEEKLRNWQKGEYSADVVTPKNPPRRKNVEKDLTPAQLRCKAVDYYLRLNRDRLKDAATASGCKGWKSRERCIKKLGGAEFQKLTEQRIHELMAVVKKTKWRRSGAGGGL